MRASLSILAFATALAVGRARIGGEEVQIADGSCDGLGCAAHLAECAVDCWCDLADCAVRV
jgi:hypothetical protein